MAELPFFPIATDAYLADCDHLSDAEHGRYFQILIAMWRAPKQRLPNDDEWLARKFRRSVAAVVAELRPVISEFCKCDGNWITQKRLAKEFEYLTNKSARQRAKGEKRWGGDRVRTNAATRSQRMAEARRLGTHTTMEWATLKSLFGCCTHCGTSEYPLEKDHIRPVYQGGSDAIENIQPSCAKCNARKGPENIDKRSLRMPAWTGPFEAIVGRILLKDKEGNVCLSGRQLTPAPTPTPTPTPTPQ